MARNITFTFSECSNSQSPRIWSSLSGIHWRMLGCQGNVAPRTYFSQERFNRTNTVHCEKIWRDIKLKNLKSGSIDMNLMIKHWLCRFGKKSWNAKGIRKKTQHLQSMTYVRPSNVSNVIGTELASAAVSGTGSNAPEELSKLERDWARIVGRKTEAEWPSGLPSNFSR